MMAGQDFALALDQHLAWGLSVLDLKDAIWGKSLIDLTDEEALRAADEISRRDLAVYCLSSVLFDPEVELGESEFRRNHLARVDRLAALSRILKPQVVRLLAAQTRRRADLRDTIPYLRESHPWLIPLYGEAVDRLHAAGFHVTIENEAGNCIFGSPEEIVAFFEELRRPGRVSFTWDVQNLWEVGAFPSLEVYRRLRGVIGGYHVKGGRHDGSGTRMRWRSSLEDASWPVVEITRQVVADGVCPVICLNPSHGAPKDGYDYADITKRDLDFLRREIPGVE
jgi:hypothetical protein